MALEPQQPQASGGRQTRVSRRVPQPRVPRVTVAPQSQSPRYHKTTEKRYRAESCEQDL